MMFMPDVICFAAVVNIYCYLYFVRYVLQCTRLGWSSQCSDKVMDWTTRKLGFDSWQEQRFSAVPCFRWLRLIQPHRKWVPGFFSVVVKQPRHEPDHLHPSTTEIRKRGLFLHTLIFMAWCSTKCTDNITLCS